MARIYTNENFPLPVAIELRQRNHDVLTTVETGMAGKRIADPEVLAFAISQHRILVTLNRRHFIRLHQTVPDHFGIIVCTYDPDFTALAVRIHDALERQDNLTAQLVRVNRPG
jgi:hypothetical protein